MAPRTFRWLGSLAFVALATAALEAGGWAVITVSSLPDAVKAGEPVTVTYAVRQHGRHLLTGLQGRVEARFDGTIVRASATPLPKDGHYAATLLLPHAGTWTLEIVSGFLESSGRAVLHVVEPGATAPVRSSSAKGGQLFVSKGCATCHTESWSSAPRLQPNGYAPDALARLLSTGSIRGEKEFGMPNLELDAAEIADLVAFLNVRRAG